MKTEDIIDQQMSPRITVHSNEPDHEVQMARSELYRAGKCAISLHNMLKKVSEQQGLEGWVQAKITKAADYLESVYHYLDYEMHGEMEIPEAGPVAPGSVPAGGITTPGDKTAPKTNDGSQQLERQKAAAAIAVQKKQIQDQIRATQKQLQDLQKQLQTVGNIAQAQPMAETSAGATSAGSVATAVSTNGMGKKKKEVGTLFGGSYKSEAANAAQQAAIAINMKKAGKKPKSEKEVEEGETGPKFTGYWKGKDKGKPGKKMVGSSS